MSLTFQDYEAGSLERAQKGLLTIWGCLADYHKDLVLVGGLAVRYLTNPPPTGSPGVVTGDVDFAISIGAARAASPMIRDRLKDQDFVWKEGRFTRVLNGTNLHVDLLTDDDRNGTFDVEFENLYVLNVPGVRRALVCHREVEVKGATLLEEERTERIRVAEVGPILVLKLKAFAERTTAKKSKDAYDILYLAMNYLDGTDQAIARFHEERSAGNRGMANAIACLQEHFLSVEASGPVSCADFLLHSRPKNPETTAESLKIRQHWVTLAEALLA